MEICEKCRTRSAEGRTKGSRFKSGADISTDCSATIAVIGQGLLFNVCETEAPDKEEDWQKYCLRLCGAAGAVNAAIHALDQDAGSVAIAALQQSCDDCHAVFHR